MERKIGEKFFDHNIPIKCVATDSVTCYGCYYANGKKLCNKKHGFVGECSSKDREDKTNVIFVRV